MKFTWAPSTKFEPPMFSVNAGPCATTLDGLNVEICGGGKSTAKSATFEAPPPGDGFTTVIPNVPGVVKSAGGIAALNCVGPTYVVGTACPAKSTIEPDTKPVPITVRVSEVPPSSAKFGDNEEMVGAGLLDEAGVGTKNETEGELVSELLSVANSRAPVVEPKLPPNCPVTIVLGLPPVGKLRKL